MKYPIPKGYRMAFPNYEAGYASAAKYDKGQPCLDEEAWTLAGEWTKQHFHPFMSQSCVVSQEEAVSDMEMGSSPGYPWNRKYTDKRSMVLDGTAATALAEYWMQLEDPEGAPIFWNCSQKVELRSVEKLKLNRIRTFLASSFEHSASLNRMCVDQNNKFYNSNNKTWSFVGGTKFLQGWDRLIRRLGRFDTTFTVPNAFELDESDYDSSLFARALWEQAEIRWSFLRVEDRTPANRMRLHNLYYEIVNSIMVMDAGEVIMKDTGNPSGSANTIVDNTMILFRLFAYAWIILCKEIGRDTSYVDFMESVEAALNGDDNSYSCSKEAAEFFTPANIARVWSAIGITTKTPCEQPRVVPDLAFLSQSTRWDEDLSLFVPVPDTQKVLSSLLWGSDLNDVRWHYLRACALRIDSFMNLECRKVIDEYISWLRAEYHDSLVGDVIRDNEKISMKQIFGVWKSDEWISALYSGREAAIGGYVPQSVDAIVSADKSSLWREMISSGPAIKESFIQAISYSLN